MTPFILSAAEIRSISHPCIASKSLSHVILPIFPEPIPSALAPHSRLPVRVGLVVQTRPGPPYSSSDRWSPLTFSCQAAGGALSGDGDEGCARSQGDGSTSSSIEGQRGSNPRDCARAI